MQAAITIKLIATSAFCAWAPAAFAHENAGWAAIHWHASDFLGLATVAGLTLMAVWLSRRSSGAAKT